MTDSSRSSTPNVDDTPKIGVHRAFGIRCDHDDASPGRDLLRVAASDETDSDRSHVVAEDLPEIVVVHLADVRRRTAEARDADDGVGSRTTAHLDRTGEDAVQLDGAFGLDQRHRPLHQFVLGKELVGRRGRSRRPAHCRSRRRRTGAAHSLRRHSTSQVTQTTRTTIQARSATLPPVLCRACRSPTNRSPRTSIRIGCRRVSCRSATTSGCGHRSTMRPSPGR